MTGWRMDTTTNLRIYNKWYALISNGYLLDAQYVDFYAKFYNAYNSTTTDLRHVEIHDENEGVSGLRLSLNKRRPDGGGLLRHRPGVCQGLFRRR